MLERLVTLILAVGILPSFTALSATIRENYPQLSRYVGPLNVLKFALPILLYYLWIRRKDLHRRLLAWVGGALAVGTVATVIAGMHEQCGGVFPPGLVREWAVILVGCIAGLCFVLLPAKEARYVVIAWGTAVFGSAVLDYIFPSSIEWLLGHIFDPETRALDFKEIGHPVLTGIYGRQSMAKMLAWMPWLVLAFVYRSGRPATKNWPFFVLAVLSTAGTLGTSQRGPFLAALTGWAAFAIHEWYQLRRKTMAVLACYAIGLSLVMTMIIVPRPVLEARVLSIFANQTDNPFAGQANANVEFRKTMLKFSLRQIADYPLGRACINQQSFEEWGITHWNHSHNILVQQYRERGWIWGTLHLLLWCFALVGAWRTRTEIATSLFSGITATLVLGMFDHPWFVLNHSMVLWVFLWMGLNRAYSAYYGQHRLQNNR